MDAPKKHSWNTRKGKNRVHKPRKYARADDYNSGEWKRLRKYILAREPLCRHCAIMDEVVPATEVDHIIPHSGRSDPLYRDTSNMQSLCRSCHGRKSAKETHQKIKDKKAAKANTP